VPVPLQRCVATEPAPAPLTLQLDAEDGRTRLEIHCGTARVEASARRVRMEPSSKKLMLEGDVQLRCTKQGRDATEIHTGRLTLDVTDGDLKIQLGD
jgi:hypothetical protein